MLWRKQLSLANPLTYRCLKLWPCHCSNATSHSVTGHLFSAASFLLTWEGLGHAACPVIPSSAQWDTPAVPLCSHFLAQPAAKLWHPSMDLQFWEKLSHGFSMGLCSFKEKDSPDPPTPLPPFIYSSRQNSR